jgi:hypothetical protein
MSFGFLQDLAGLDFEHTDFIMNPASFRRQGRSFEAPCCPKLNAASFCDLFWTIELVLHLTFPNLRRLTVCTGCNFDFSILCQFSPNLTDINLKLYTLSTGGCDLAVLPNLVNFSISVKISQQELSFLLQILPRSLRQLTIVQKLLIPINARCVDILCAKYQFLESFSITPIESQVSQWFPVLRSRIFRSHLPSTRGRRIDLCGGFFFNSVFRLFSKFLAGLSGCNF